MLPEIAVKKELAVDGRPYPIIEAGEGPLVVCLHGFPDNYESFQNQIEPSLVVMPGNIGHFPQL